MNASKESNIMEIDGSVMEGGGQILRIAIALSAILRKPIRVINIRAGRKSPGLRPQHLAGVELVKNICSGRLEGGQIGSTQISFFPNVIRRGNFLAETGTAGSIVLLLQVALPCLLFSDGPTELTLKGGTNAEMAPQIDYTQMVFKPIAERMGVKFDIDVIRRGYFPKGGGIINAKVYPVEKCLQSLNLIEKTKLTKITGYSFVAGVLPIKVAHIMADEATRALKRTGVPINITRVKETPENAMGTGTGIVVTAETENGCFLASSALGRRGVPAEQIGRSCGEDLMVEINHGGCVDQHLQDQLIILMALAQGTSRLRVSELTLHTRTAIHVTELLAQEQGVQFNVNETEQGGGGGGGGCIIECKGIGWTRQQ